MRRPTALAAFLAVPLAAALAQAPTIGEFVIQNPGGDAEIVRRADAIQMTLTGPKLAIVGPNVEFHGRKIWARAATKSSRVTNGTASGGVWVKLTDPKTGQTDVITGDRAEFKAGVAPKTGHIDILGKTVWKSFDKAQKSAQTASGEGVSIDFAPDEQTIKLKNLDASLRVEESPKKDKK